MKATYDKVSLEASKLITKRYSTSFSLGILLLGRELRDPIYGIYGFVRAADEIVDTFHGYPKERLLTQFRNDTYNAIDEGLSLNPVLHSFQQVVNNYGISKDLIEHFFNSMFMDLEHTTHERPTFDEYVYGSAEAVGLMCLKVFTKGDEALYRKLESPARSLGSAFQKVNFLRDLQADYRELQRCYFPGVDPAQFSKKAKIKIEAEIEEEFDKAFEGIVNLPEDSKRGVYLAYIYYRQLLKKIRSTPAEVIMEKRIRIPNALKLALLFQAYARCKANAL